MQIGLFELLGDKIVATESALTLPFLVKIKEKYIKDYLDIFAYLFFMTCWDSRNVFINIPMNEREGKIIDTLELEVCLEDTLIVDALEQCKILYDTPMVGAFKAAKMMVDKVALYLRNATPVDGKFSNIPDIDKFMNKLPDYIDTYEKIGQKLKEEQSRIRGGKIIAYDQI